MNIARFNDASNFVDTTINGLLKISIDEKLHTETLVLDRETPIVTFVLLVPGTNDPFTYAAKPNSAPRVVGKWTVVAERFDGSLFADETLGDDDTFVPAVASVLNFRVADDKSVRETLAGEDSVTAGRDELIKSNEKTAGDLARKLCRSVAAKADSLGFSPRDVNWVVSSYIIDMALPTAISPTALAGCGFYEQVAKSAALNSAH